MPNYGLKQRSAPGRRGACGRRGRRPSNRSRDKYGIRANPRRSSLEGRRPRRLVTTRDIILVETFVPEAGGA